MSSRVALVVDDEALVRLAIAESLRDADFEVLEAMDAAEALDVLARRPNIRLLCTDVQMPGMDGLELAQIARACCPALRVIIISGVRGITCPDGMSFLAKPFRPARLVEVACATASCPNQAGHLLGNLRGDRSKATS